MKNDKQEKKVTYVGLARSVLRQSEKPLSPAEIWQNAGKVQREKVSQNSGNPHNTLGAILHQYTSNEANLDLLRHGRNPIRYYLKARENDTDFDADSDSDSAPSGDSMSAAAVKRESLLHPLLCHFARHNQNFAGGKEVLTKTIHHQNAVEKKSGKGFRHWIFPDMVGVYLPHDWAKPVLDFGKKISSDLPLLFSFEIKRELDRGTHRASFFQAVSNSSWANEGYLVAPKIQDDVLSELRQLSNSFGIGIIQLCVDSDGFEGDSAVLFPARRNPYLDWEMMNKMSASSPDFQAFLSSVQANFDCGQAHNEDYDEVKEDIDACVKKYIAAEDSADKARAAKKSAHATTSAPPKTTGRLKNPTAPTSAPPKN